MEKCYYIFECSGPYNWQEANVVTGPDYDEHSWFSGEGYKTLGEAEEALEAYYKEENYYGTFFIVSGFKRNISKTAMEYFK